MVVLLVASEVFYRTGWLQRMIMPVATSGSREFVDPLSHSEWRPIIDTSISELRPIMDTSLLEPPTVEQSTNPGADDAGDTNPSEANRSGGATPGR